MSLTLVTKQDGIVEGDPEGAGNQHDVCRQIWCMCWLSPDAKKKNVSMTNVEVGIFFSPPSSFCRYRVIRYWFSLPIINLAVAVGLTTFRFKTASVKRIEFRDWFSSKDDTTIYNRLRRVGVVFVCLIIIFSTTRGATEADTAQGRVKG